MPIAHVVGNRSAAKSTNKPKRSTVNTAKLRQQHGPFIPIVPPPAPINNAAAQIGFRPEFDSASSSLPFAHQPQPSGSNSSNTQINRQQQPMSVAKDRGPCSRVELMLSAKSLADKDVFSKSDPLCVVEELVPRGSVGQMHFVEVGRTDYIKNCLNPQWNKKIVVNYYFESKQLLRFNIYDIDSESAQLSDHDFLGRCEVELADIVAAPGGALSLSVKEAPNRSGVLTVRAEEMDEGQRETVYFVCHGVGMTVGSQFCGACLGVGPEAFLEFYRLNADGSRQMVHRTEPAAAGVRNPEWRPFEVPARYLCGVGVDGDKNREFIVECYEQHEATGNHRLIGALRTSINALTRQKGVHVDLVKQKGGKPKNTGTIHFLDAQLRIEHTFLDYISAGLQLEFAVSVDLTASNGEVTRSDSLHFLSANYLNQYECAICSVLEICEHYNRSKQFEALGFGARIPPAYAVSHMFPLRLNNFERTVNGIQGVLDGYRYAVCNTQLYGPTNFAPTIRDFALRASQFPRDGTHYQVLLILTDGVISDMEATVRAIIDASHQPISIIIVGIGNDEFTKMDILDADNCALSAGGRTAVRDIVQFVPFRNFMQTGFSQNTQEQTYLKSLLAKEVLAELPGQVCSFMKMNNIKPLSTNHQPSADGTTSTIYPPVVAREEANLEQKAPTAPPYPIH